MSAPHSTGTLAGMALDFTIVRRDGRLFHLWSDGTLLPLISGGADDGDDAAKAAADKAAADAKAAEDAKAAADAKNDPPAKVTFTPEQQAHIDTLIQKNTGKSKAAAEKDFKTWLDQQAMGETDRLKAEKATADQAVLDAKAEALTARVETTAERLALAAGCKPDRVTKLLRLLDLTGDNLATDGKPDLDAIKALVEKELADTPELKGTSGPAGKSGGEFNDGEGKRTWTRAEIAALAKNPAEFAKHEADIDLALKEGRVAA